MTKSIVFLCINIGKLQKTVLAWNFCNSLLCFAIWRHSKFKFKDNIKVSCPPPSCEIRGENSISLKSETSLSEAKPSSEDWKSYYVQFVSVFQLQPLWGQELDVLFFIISQKNCSACSSNSLPALEVHFGMMAVAACKVIFSDLPDLSCEQCQILWPPIQKIPNKSASNTLTSTLNNSASTNAMNKLRTYSESWRSYLYFIFSGVYDQTSGTGWKWHFFTDTVIAYWASNVFPPSPPKMGHCAQWAVRGGIGKNFWFGKKAS